MQRLYVLLVLVIFTSSCVYSPVLRDDFSVMRDDMFTRTIKEVRGGEGNDLVIDLHRGWVVGSGHFKGMAVMQIEGIFLEAGGVCRKEELGSVVLLCSLSRAWRYKNIGAYSDPASWCVPSMALTYKFHILRRDDPSSTWYELEFFAVSSGTCPFRGM